MDTGLIVGLSVGGFVVVAAIAYLILKLLPAKKIPVHHIRCPDCGQKVRYVQERAGREVKCPRCRRQIILPATAQPLAKAKGRLVPGTRKDDKDDKR